MYILINKNTNKVNHISEKIFTEYSENLILAEVNSLPEKYDYLKAENIMEVVDKWTEVQENYDENGEIVVKEVEKTRTYKTCKLKACFKTEPSTEMLERFKQAKYETLVERLIRNKYSLSNELAILRQASTKTAEFEVYNAYAEECKAKARLEIYG